MQTPEQRELSVDLIDENPDQVRTEYEPVALNELAESISKTGLIQAVTVKRTGERFMILQGSRRFRAHKLLRKTFIRCNIIDDNNGEGLAIMLHENLFRDDLTPLEEANFFHRLMSSDLLSIEQLIHYTNKPEGYVRSRLHLLETPPELQQAVHERKLPVSHALELAKIDNLETQSQYLAYAISTGASLATVKYWRQGYEANKQIPPSVDTLPLKVDRPSQIPVFGWNCPLCENFHEASTMHTLHLCKADYGAFMAEIQKGK